MTFEMKPTIFSKSALGVIFTFMISFSISSVLGEILSSKLQVEFPPTLTKKEGYLHSKASFGFPSYSGSISLQLIYADSDLCDPNSINTSRGYPVLKDGWFQRKPWGSWGAFILLVNDGGGCSRVQKVRHAQHVGASGVLIAPMSSSTSQDDPCSTNNSTGNVNTVSCTSSLTSSPYDIQIMDDGSAGDVSIPSFYMTNVTDADAIKQQLVAADATVLVEMSWNTNAASKHIVQYDLWTSSPLDGTFITFVKDFKDIAIALNDYTLFEPHSHIHDGSQFLCIGSDSCKTLCTNNGRYCASDPDGDLYNGISGADVVLESLRRRCIWNHYGSSWGGHRGDEWWSYVGLFADHCANPTNFSNEGCARGVYHQVGINVKAIVQCMEDSGGLTNDVSNALLDEEIKARSEFGMILLPSILIDGVPLRDEVSPYAVCQALCVSLWNGTDPAPCSLCMKATISTNQQSLESTDVVSTTTSFASSNSVPEKTLYITVTYLIVAVVSIGAVALWIKNKLYTRTMQDQVRGILAQYMTCDEQEPQQHELELNHASLSETSLDDKIRFGVVGNQIL